MYVYINNKMNERVAVVLSKIVTRANNKSLETEYMYLYVYACMY